MWCLVENVRGVYNEMRAMGKSSFTRINGFQDNIAQGRPNQWRCRAGGRYLYICEDGLVHYCSQQRGHPQRAEDQPDDAAEIISKKIGWSTEAVLAAHTVSGPLLSHDGTVSMEALKTMQDTLLELGVIKKRLPIDEHVAKAFYPVRF